jgi:hypothetical protein
LCHELAREQPLRVHDLRGVLLRALDRDEEVRPVLRDGAAEAAAELIAPVVALGWRRAGFQRRERFVFGQGIHRLVPEQPEEAALKQVRAALGRDVHLDVFLRHGGETLQLRRDVVQADGKRGQAVDAFRIAGFAAREARRSALGGDRDTRHGRALLIEDPTGDVAGGLLREHRCGGKEPHEYRSEELFSHLNAEKV